MTFCTTCFRRQEPNLFIGDSDGESAVAGDASVPAALKLEREDDEILRDRERETSQSELQRTALFTTCVL